MENEVSSVVKVRFGDCDPIGHLNNVKYLEYMLNAREDHVEDFYGFTYEEYSRQTGCTWLAVQNEIAYIKEVRYNSKVVISSKTIEIGDRISKVEILMKSEDLQTVHAVLWITVIYFNLKTRLSEPQPAEVKEKFAHFLVTLDQKTLSERAAYLRKQNKTKSMKKIIVTGGNGQLGNCLRKIVPQFEGNYEFIFANSSELDITDEVAVDDFFEVHRPHFCINASAYTAVDLAETEKDKCFAVNSNGAANLANACRNVRAVFIHISTDYVFDGDTNLPYSEDNFTNPLGIYGQSKREGEERALEANPHTIILRTSWLYSEFNKNFVKTMLHLFSQKPELGIVADQFGQPTNANDLAEAIMTIIRTEPKKYGIYHFSNYPETTWYDFTKEIAKIAGSPIVLKAITTEQYPTPAKRPKRSTFCLDKIENDYKIKPKRWEQSLEDCLAILLEK